MKKSQFILVSQLKEQLQGLPAIVSSLEKKDPLFVEKTIVWLKAVEDILSTNTISEVSEIAGFRSKILAGRISDERGFNAKKNQLKITAGLLYDAQNCVLNVLLPHEGKMNECRDITKQLLALAAQTNTLVYHPEVKFEDFIQQIWWFILSDPNLNPGGIKLKSMLSEMDIIMLIADEIDIKDFS
ncbi:hypothetical protein C1637_03045 [Chryseobacterium lactis]|uniref:Uncharacterized protein n=1 Tax=Chryseobacterium lactis TaxID=1241981 RepID=A0A3G6RNL3_CHRLC|nr:hypothetical protein [Chryseobacterium lactis]AZA81563.1 hypothetical protein EG342_06440 [Chryseobacterium lactis]AZB06561.1 hypothetical protein EG341_22560 [Chryseobacterium lactis]PNW15412.1 hypothetical protein C1637_03045 [Chryseobacterium lactis]